MGASHPPAAPPNPPAAAPNLCLLGQLPVEKSLSLSLRVIVES